MNRSQRRHLNRKFKLNHHPAAKCSQAKCMACSGKKVLKIKNRQRLRADAKNKES